jgi:hypothetical protein
MMFELLHPFETLFLSAITSVRTPATIIPCPKGRLAWARSPRHFVPGYDRAVPPAHFATAFSQTLLRNGRKRVP